MKKAHLSLSPRMLTVIAASGLAAVLISCENNHTFSQEKDIKALQRISKTWSATYGGVPFSIGICEDVETNKQQALRAENSCHTSHVVRSQRSADEEKSYSVEQPSGVGCGGCEFNVISFVTGTITMPDSSIKNLSGKLVIGSDYDDDPYAGDYSLFLSTDSDDTDEEAFSAGERIKLVGRIKKDGELILSGDDMYAIGFQVNAAEVLIDKFEELTCGVPATSEDDV